MALVRQLIQICMIEAIRGRTLAGDHVIDSNIAAIGKLDFKGDKPVLAISIEETDQDGKYDNGFFGRTSEMKLYVQAAVATKATISIEDEDGGEGDQKTVEVVEIGSTDAAREATLNILDRQWRQALVDPDNEWGDRFRQLAPLVGRIRDTRITDPEGGRKYAARVTEIPVTTVPEPEYGHPLPEDIAAILDAVAAVPDYADLARIWTALIESEALDDDDKKQQARAWLSTNAYAALGFGPIVDGAGTFDEAVIAIEGREDVTIEEETDNG